MRDTIQVRAMDDYFHSLLLDEPLVLDEVEEVQSAPVLQLQRQPQCVPDVVAAPYLESDPRLAQLGELLAQVGQVQFENDAFTQEVTLTAPLEIVAEESSHNPLTRLPNRQLSHERIEQLLQGGQPFAHALVAEVQADVPLAHGQGYQGRQAGREIGVSRPGQGGGEAGLVEVGLGEEGACYEARQDGGASEHQRFSVSMRALSKASRKRGSGQSSCTPCPRRSGSTPRRKT